MAEVLHIQVPDEVRSMLNRTPEEFTGDVRLYAALMLFWLGKLSSGAAAELAGLPRVMFLDRCVDYRLPVSNVTSADLQQELAAWPSQA